MWPYLSSSRRYGGVKVENRPFLLGPLNDTRLYKYDVARGVCEPYSIRVQNLFPVHWLVFAVLVLSFDTEKQQQRKEEKEEDGDGNKTTRTIPIY